MHLVQIAWVHVSLPSEPSSRLGSIERVLSYVVEPGGFTISQGTQEIHGITTARYSGGIIPSMMYWRRF